MLVSAAINSKIMRIFQEKLPLSAVPSYVIQDSGLIGHTLTWNKYIHAPLDFEVFLYISAAKKEIKWAVREWSDESFEKLKHEHFNLTTEEALLRIPFHQGTKDILHNLNIFRDIMKEEWDSFLALSK